MDSHPPLEFLLQTLANSPEEDKRALVRSALGLLREVCNIHTNSSYPKFQDTAKQIRNILDQILVGKIDAEDEEEFLESGDFAWGECSSTTSISKKPAPEIVATTSPLHDLVEKWNSKVEPWLQIVLPQNLSEVDTIIALIKNASALRSNLASAVNLRNFQKEEIKLFDKYWQIWQQEISQQGYEVFPNQFGRLPAPVGEIIYSCRPRIKSEEDVLIMPGLKKDGEEILAPLSLVTLPPSEPFPENHPDRDLSFQWRGILGELELLTRHLMIQNSVVCAVESTNKSGIEPFTQCHQTILNEVKRRGDALRNAVRKKESIYRLATNYWRVEECFWAIFHDDGRPTGYSFFDRLRRRSQGWRSTVRKENKLFTRDFVSGKDSLASINKYIGNIILQTKEGVSPGTVLRELRPAIVVKVNNVTRLLKGRVIST